MEQEGNTTAIYNNNGTMTVQPGDTLWGMYGPNWKQMSGYTGDPTKLPVGTVLPNASGVKPNYSPVPQTPMTSPPPKTLSQAMPLGTTNMFGATQKPNQLFNPLSIPQTPTFTSPQKTLPQAMPLGTTNILGQQTKPTPSMFPPSFSTPKQTSQTQPPQSGDVFAESTPDWIKPILSQVSKKYGVPTALLSAVAAHESGHTWNPQIKQYGGGLGRGIFQIDLGQNPVTEQQAFDPTYAADFAAKMLADNYKSTGSWWDALRKYNGGGNYDSQQAGYNGQPLADITNGYADTVLSNLPSWAYKQYGRG